MPSTLSPSGSFGPGTITVPNDGEPRNAASVLTPFQQLVDQTGWAKARLDAGVERVRSVANVVALKGVTGQQTGDHAIVKDLGLFEFDAASAVASNDVTIITPTTGGGRWLHVNRGATVANGFAPLDATGKVPPAQLRGQHVSRATTGVTSFSSGTANVAEGVAVASLFSLSLTSGQFLEVCGTFFCSHTSGAKIDGDRVRFYLSVVKPSLVPDYLLGPVAYAGYSNERTGLSGKVAITESGTHTVRLMVQGSINGLTYGAIASAQFDAYVISPP